MDWPPIRMTYHVRTYTFGDRLIPEMLGKEDVPDGTVAETWEISDQKDTRATITETFGPDYFAGRRYDRWPFPNVAKIQAAVRDAVLHPERARARGLPSVAQSC